MQNLKKKSAVFIGAGEFTEEENRKEHFSEEAMIFALDGGLLYCERYGIMPNYIVGDFDSLPEEKQNLFTRYPKAAIIKLPKEKDETDMLAAVKMAVKQGAEEFVIYGGLGGRLSHTIANLQCLMYLKEQGKQGILRGRDTKAFLLQNEKYTFGEASCGYLSVFAYGGNAKGVTLENVKYELENAELSVAFPLGVSNEFAEAKKAVIEVKEGTLLIVLDR